MKDNALRVILFIYILSGCLVAIDLTINQQFGLQWTTPTGEPAGPLIRDISERMANHDQIIQQLEAAGQMDFGNAIDAGIKSLELGLAMSGEMLKLMAGIYAFDILTIFGVPWEFTAVIQGAYVILLAHSVISYLPHIASAVQALASTARMCTGAVRAGANIASNVPTPRFGFSRHDTTDV